MRVWTFLKFICEGGSVKAGLCAQSAQDAVPQYEVAGESKTTQETRKYQRQRSLGLGLGGQAPGRDSELLWLVLAPCLPAS